jgi:hypothetical protein
MTDHSWFKLLVRAIGLLILGLGGPSLLFSLTGLLVEVWDQSVAQYGVMRYVAVTLPPMLAYGAQTAFGLYLFLGAERLISRCMRDVRGHCPACGYDLSSTSTGRCPECGTDVPVASSTADPSQPSSH